VVRVVDPHQARKSNGFAGAGVEFFDLPPGSLARIRDYVTELTESRPDSRPPGALHEALMARSGSLERHAKAQSHANAARAEMEEQKFDKALANATLAASYAPMRDDFQELRRQLLARVNNLKAQVAFRKGEYLLSEQQPEEAIKAFDEACELEPTSDHLKRSAALRLTMGRDLVKARALAQLAVALNDKDVRARELVQQLVAALKKAGA
jgi:tetratricopeptide (TPR) repeat protein